MSVERLTHEADFGFEDWEETLFFVKSDPNGAYNILDIAKYQGEDEFDEILKNIALRLSEIENILGDIYDLDRLRELVEADKDGRCVVTPFKVGDTVFKIKDGRVESDKVYRITIDVFGDVFIKLQWERESMKEKDARKILFSTKKAAEASIAKDVCYE